MEEELPGSLQKNNKLIINVFRTTWYTNTLLLISMLFSSEISIELM